MFSGQLTQPFISIKHLKIFSLKNTQFFLLKNTRMPHSLEPVLSEEKQKNMELFLVPFEPESLSPLYLLSENLEMPQEFQSRC